jgi:hypothetical protein
MRGAMPCGCPSRGGPSGGKEKDLRWCIGGREEEAGKKGPDRIRRLLGEPRVSRLEAGKGIHFTIRSFRLIGSRGDLGGLGATW